MESKLNNHVCHTEGDGYTAEVDFFIICLNLFSSSLDSKDGPKGFCYGWGFFTVLFCFSDPEGATFLDWVDSGTFGVIVCATFGVVVG